MIGTASNLAWKTHADDRLVARSHYGSCYQGDVMVPYHTLVAKFGQPVLAPDDTASAIWVIEFATPEGPVIATIYDWHVQPPMGPEFEVDWRIGGFGSDARDCVLQALWDVIGVQPDAHYTERRVA